MSRYEDFPIPTAFRNHLLEGLGEPIQDIDEWAENALQEAAIEAVAEPNRELFLSFAATLGEVALRRQGIDLTPLEERL